MANYMFKENNDYLIYVGICVNQFFFVILQIF